MKLTGTTVHLSPTYHPKMNTKTERLRSLCGVVFKVYVTQETTHMSQMTVCQSGGMVPPVTSV